MILHGTVVKLFREKGFGFIRPDKGGLDQFFFMGAAKTFRLKDGGINFSKHHYREVRGTQVPLPLPNVRDRVVFRSTPDTKGPKAEPWGYELEYLEFLKKIQDSLSVWYLRTSVQCCDQPCYLYFRSREELVEMMETLATEPSLFVRVDFLGETTLAKAACAFESDPDNHDDPRAYFPELHPEIAEKAALNEPSSTTILVQETLSPYRSTRVTVQRRGQAIHLIQITFANGKGPCIRPTEITTLVGTLRGWFLNERGGNLSTADRNFAAQITRSVEEHLNQS